jgi:glycosyltransferase involved in cell wall biosynthesis
MKILHLVGGGESGGAAKGALLLHYALNDLAIESSVLVQDSLNFTIKNRIYKTLDRALLVKYPYKDPHSYFSPGYFGQDVLKTLDQSNFDILHLHWISNGFFPIEDLSLLKKPIVWTFRDMWPMTGGCHYSDVCRNFTKNCGECSALRSTNGDDLSRKMLGIKKIVYENANLFPVAISSWLRDQAKSSALFQDKSVRMINNCIDINNISIWDKNEARKSLGIAIDKKVICFGALHSLDDKRKGYQFLRQAIANIENRENYLLVIFGNKSEMYSVDMEVKSFGYVSSQRLLGAIYSAADCFVAPSTQEAFGKTIGEALHCGTPVVAFSDTGAESMIDNKIDGYLAKNGSAEDLAVGIKYVIDHNFKDINRSNKMVKNFSPAVAAKQYHDLYLEITNS